MNIRFQIAGKDDIPLIQCLSRTIWQEHYPGIISRAQIDYMLAKMYSSATLQSEMKNEGYRYIVVSDQDEPIGYIAFRYDPDEAAILLSKIYLLPLYHGKGVGRQMLQYVKNDASTLGTKTIQLFVNRNNSKAIRAYERFGFVKAEKIVTDIGGGFVMDDFRMELRLK